MLRKIVKKQNIILAVGLLALMLAGGLVIYKIKALKEIPQAEAASYPVTIKSVQRGIYQAGHGNRFGFANTDTSHSLPDGRLKSGISFPAEGKITISKAVDPAKSIVLINGVRFAPMSTGGYPAAFRGIGVAGYLREDVNGDGVVDATTNELRIVYDILGDYDADAWISWEVAEFTGDIKVLRGFMNVGNSYPYWSEILPLTDNANNPLIDYAKSFIIAYSLPNTADVAAGGISPPKVNGWVGFNSPSFGGSCGNREGDGDGDGIPEARIGNTVVEPAPNLFLCFGRGSTLDEQSSREPIVYWQAIELKSSIQSNQAVGASVGTCGAPSEARVSIPPVNPSKSFIPTGGFNIGCGSDPFPDVWENYVGRTVRLISSNQIWITFMDTAGKFMTTGGDPVVEFNSSSGVSVQRDFYAMHRTETFRDIDISSIDPSRSFLNVRIEPPSSYTPGKGCAWSSPDSRPHTRYATAYLLNNTTLRIEQYPTDPNDSTNQNKCAPVISWEVITFPGRNPLTLPSYTDAISAGSTKVRAVHINELRAQINRAQEEAGLSQNNWTDGSNCIQNGRTVLCVQSDSTKIRAVHFNELCSAITDLKNNLAVFVPLTCSTSRSGQIRAQHLIDLRNDLYNLINAYNSG